ncbi:phosphatase PAP2 family protein [Rhizobium sp. CG5]|uniref:phosphatase PAP2 family protein n=1 Tax=Rhizobium sp. CG5 TaxID=2726076 RepID=UPI002033D842|nr:phosphatase PAP2 family protein [Rhizobium sp. CG5]MCM2473964.1 phosphatase PAP2 family protein [Rhizobium sp. CG5]
MYLAVPAIRDSAARLTPPSERPALQWALRFAALWFLLLATFHAFPQIDIAVARFFFRPFTCLEPQASALACGHFPNAGEQILVRLRKVLFYLPSLSAVFLLWLLIECLQQHGATYQRAKTRTISLTLLSFVIGPYILVNLILKSISGRPRPNETDLFGGDLGFTAAGTFDGLCDSNCSFVSGEAAGAGWLACLVILLPARLRPVLGPPILVLSVTMAAMRVSFGGHYLSDVMLGWLLSVTVFAATFATFQLLDARRTAKV